MITLSPRFTVVATAFCMAAAACSGGAESAKKDDALAGQTAQKKADAEPVDPGEGPGEPAERISEAKEPLTQPETNPQTADRPALAKARPQAVTRRIEASKARLQESEAGQLVWESIEAHGGLNRWFAYGPIRFRFNYDPIGEKPAYDTFQVVDQWGSRARHITPDDSLEFGWTGAEAWHKPASATPPVNVRFWSMTPYYFVGIPFVLADPGVNLELMGETKLGSDTQKLVRVTFDEGTGDAPNDYYVVYIDEESKRVRAVRYVVSYPGFYPEGGHGPEKFMRYEGEQEIDRLIFPETYTTYKWNGEEPGEAVTKTELTNIEFLPDTPMSYFDAPEGAKILEGW